MDQDEADFAARRVAAERPAPPARARTPKPDKQTSTASATEPNAQGNAPKSGDGLPGDGQAGKPDDAAGTAAAAASNGSSTSNKDKTKDDQANGAAQLPGEDESKLTPFERAKRREARTWKTINEQKAVNEARAADLQARENQLAERERALATSAPAAEGNRNGQGEQRFSAQEYLDAAQQFAAEAVQLENQARTLENAGRYDEADRAQAAATQRRNLEQQARGAATASARNQNGNGNGNGRPAGQAPAQANGGQSRATVEEAHTRNWATLKAELPELLNVNHPVNIETRAALQANPGLLADPAGPYRAAVIAGRKVLKSLEVEAAKVPDLTKQVDTLNKRVKELEALTAVPGGGGLPSDRLETGGVSFENLPADKREAQLLAEIHAARS